MRNGSSSSCCFTYTQIQQTQHVYSHVSHDFTLSFHEDEDEDDELPGRPSIKGETKTGQKTGSGYHTHPHLSVFVGAFRDIIHHPASSPNPNQHNPNLNQLGTGEAGFPSDVPQSRTVFTSLFSSHKSSLSDSNLAAEPSSNWEDDWEQPSHR